MVDTSNNKSVILHQYNRYGFVPNLSPPCLKLEAYLRMTKIPYTIDTRSQLSSKGKMPWIEYEGKSIADSNFVIEFLNKEFDVDVDKDLSKTERAISFGLRRMIEENTYWTLVYYRWTDNFHSIKRKLKVNSWNIMNEFMMRKIRSDLQAELHGHGIGRHTRDEVYQIARDDLRVLSDYLGDKDFMMGNKPTLLDASVFGLIANFVWAESDSPQHHFIKENLHNLEKLCSRVKEKFWPDWDEVVKFEERN